MLWRWLLLKWYRNMELWKENSVFCSLWKSQKGEPRGVYWVSVCIWALWSITQGMDPWLPARVWMELWQLVKMILERTTGCEDNVSLGVRQEKVLGANKAAERGAVKGSSLRQNRLDMQICKQLPYPAFNQLFFTLVTKLNASFSTAPSLAFGFRPGVNEYPKPNVIWLLQIY